nr:NAD(+)/NADH kinase [Rhodothermaceae bacterium]
MIYGITGNVKKEEIWQPIAEFTHWLRASTMPFVLDKPVAEGLAHRNLITSDIAEFHSRPNLPHESEVILSFGGDGTLLSTAHHVGARETPILGVNMGRLGFLADTEVQQLKDTILQLEKGKYRIESRMVLEA